MCGHWNAVSGVSIRFLVLQFHRAVGCMLSICLAHKTIHCTQLPFFLQIDLISFTCYLVAGNHTAGRRERKERPRSSKIKCFWAIFSGSCSPQRCAPSFLNSTEGKSATWAPETTLTSASVLYSEKQNRTLCQFLQLVFAFHYQIPVDREAFRHMLWYSRVRHHLPFTVWLSIQQCPKYRFFFSGCGSQRSSHMSFLRVTYCCYHN